MSWDARTMGIDIRMQIAIRQNEHSQSNVLRQPLNQILTGRDLGILLRPFLAMRPRQSLDHLVFVRIAKVGNAVSRWIQLGQIILRLFTRRLGRFNNPVASALDRII